MRAWDIKIKFAMIAVLICLVSFGVAAFFSTRWLAEEIQNDHKEKAILMGTHIIHDIGTAMVSKFHGGIPDVLDIYRNYKDVEEVRVFNLKGQEVFSKEESSPEARVEEVFRTGSIIHFHKEINKRDVATFIIPIKNKPECHTCHEKNETLRGGLLLSLNQEQMEVNIGQQRKRFLLLFGFIAIGIIASTILAVRKIFLNPIKSIQKGAEAIEKGDFEYQIPVKSRDEIGDLTENFNRMARTLHTVFRELEGKNKQLAEQFMLISRSQKEWQETFDCITDPIAVIDSNCTIIKANRAFTETSEDYFSIPQGKTINKKCDELFGTCLLSDCPHKMSVQDRRPAIREFSAQKTGKIFEISIFPYHSTEEDFWGSIAIIKNVTERTENEMRLMMTERLAALGEMASGIAHEINNPLATIAACTEGLLNRMEKEKIGSILFESYLRIIQEEINRCKNITNSMLSFVRKRDDEKKDVDINEALDKTLEMINFQGRLKDVDVLRHYQKEVPVIHNNEGDLRQVFLSIIANALDAMEGKGTLAIETGTTPPISVGNDFKPFPTKGDKPHGVENPAPQGKGGFVFIRISDTGPGIPSHLANRIFTPFFTTKSEKGGTGLGLSIANRIIKENNGKIEVSSEEGKGTTFTITLPI